MKPFTSLVSAAALAVAMLPAALPAHASVFAQFAPVSGSSDYKWVRAGSGGEFFSINGSADTTPQAVSTTFSFIDPAHAALAFLPALFTIDALSPPGNPAVLTVSAGTWTQTGLSGGFHFTYTGPDQTLGGFHLTPGEDLLSGIFTNAWIQGAGGSGSTNVTIGNGGSATYTSAVFNFDHVVAGSEEFAFNLLGVTPHFGASPGQALNSFRANGGGNFDAAFAVPEPATWSMLILGFGGIGAMLRRRRGAAALA